MSHCAIESRLVRRIELTSKPYGFVQSFQVIFKETTNLAFVSCYTLNEHQMTLTFAIFQKFLITMVVYQNFFLPLKII